MTQMLRGTVYAIVDGVVWRLILGFAVDAPEAFKLAARAELTQKYHGLRSATFEFGPIGPSWGPHA
jgi:hypothetical protein